MRLEGDLLNEMAALSPIANVTVTLKSQLVADLGFDSLSLAELAILLDQDFGIDITTLDTSRWRTATVGDVLGYPKA